MDMSMDVVRKIISEAEVEHHVSLALFGESTLYEHLPDVIKLIKTKTILYTNGLNLDISLIKEIIKAGLDKIIFSIDSSNSEEYSEVKGINGYDRVIGNMMLVMNTKKKYGSITPYVTAQFAGLDYENKIKNFPVDKVKIGRYISWGGEVDWKGKENRKIRELKPCSHIFKFLNVASNGDVVLCCMDYNHLFDIGNVNDGNVMDIWNGSKFNKIRDEQLSGKFSNMCLNCENESYYSPSK